MKNVNILKYISVAVLLISGVIFNSEARTPAYRTIEAGTTFYLYVCYGYSTNNPNGYPVVCINGGSGLGFLLDGSQLKDTWLKMLQDAIENGKRITIGYDTEEANAYSAECVPTSGEGNIHKIYSIIVSR